MRAEALSGYVSGAHIFKSPVAFKLPPPSGIYIASLHERSRCSRKLHIYNHTG